MINKVLKDVAISGVFKIGNTEFVKFCDVGESTLVMTKDTVFDSVFGATNDFRSSDVLRRLTTEFLPEISEEIGDENILPVNIDLTSLDGVKTHGHLSTKVGLPTLDFYRDHIEVFDDHKIPNKYWWLATPWSALPHYNSSSILCVTPGGSVGNSGCSYRFGVRPFCRFVSSIFVSCEGA